MSNQWKILSAGFVRETVFLVILIVGFCLMGLSARNVPDVGEISSLLAFKQSSIEKDSKGFLSNWISSSSATPCAWSGVSCSDNGRVSKLDFTNAGLIGHLHFSDLMNLQNLTSVLFSGNIFSGNLSDFSSSNPCGFEFLDLSVNKFSDLIAADNMFSSCNRLVSLNISTNHFSGEIPSSFFPSSLRYLDISSNNFSNNLLSFDFGFCGNLSVLNLSHNGFSATGFPNSLASCWNLETLDISHNRIHLKIPGDVFGKLKNLRKLVLAQNMFFGEIPEELGEVCGTLTELDLSSNQFIGELPPNFASCTALVSLNLSTNQLSGEFLGTVVSSITSLKHLYIPFNNITGMVPRSLTNCRQLQVLDLSSNSFTGNVPSEFCSVTSGSVLEKLLLANNNLTGSVPRELGLCKNLRTIDLSFNFLNGSIPQEIWNLPVISEIVMWANNLTGEIPEGICVSGGNLQMLVLNNNLITGILPKSIINCTNLIWLSLSSNRLSGEIPSDIGNLVNLAILQLGNNSISGEIPSGIGNCRNLIWLDLNSNELMGPIPLELASQAGLMIPGVVSGIMFAFVRNEAGTECRGAGGLLELQGIRVQRLENFPMVHSCRSVRIYTGSTVYTYPRNGSMIYLDLSYNHLSGTIPESIGLMSYLQVLNLGHNNITGGIPSSFGGLKTIGVFDLSHNHLQGFIPGSLGGLSFISDFDVSNNNLTGLIPSGGQLTTFPASRYENNSGLCGVPLPPCGSANSHHESSILNKGKKQDVAVAMAIGIMASVVCILLLVYALYKVKTSQKKCKKREKYMDSLPTSGSSSWKLSTVPEPLSINVATFEKPLRKLTFAHLLEATNGFGSESLIGSGGFGDVYRAQMKDGSVVAIKKLIHVTGQGDREFMAEMETIGKIKHRNLVPLLGYCKIGEERLLVYEYMKWGSLEAVLHEKDYGLTLDWSSRKKIAIGSARGLAFLHHSCIPHIIHRDMKSSNVLLDENFEARVSDFGMARLVNALDSHLSVSTLAGTPGYVPPEYYQSFRCTAKGDVYSYGVVLLELLSGKKPIDTLEFGDDNNLVGWAKMLHKQKRSHEILDPDLITSLSGDAELYHYLKIAFECLDDKAHKRPTMIQVMAKFKDLQADSESDILDGMSAKSSVFDESQEKEVQ